MSRKLMLPALIIVLLVVLFYRTPFFKNTSYINELIYQVAVKTSPEGELYTPVISPMVKEDRKDDDQYDIVAVYTNLQGDLLGQVLILPDGIVEPFEMSVVVFNITATELLFMEKHDKTPMPDKLNHHKLMKPCYNEVVIPVLYEIGFKVHNLSSIVKTDTKYKYHNMGYCTKLTKLTDRYLEIDGKSTEKQKFKFEFLLPIMSNLYPELYKLKTFDLSGWSYIEYLLIILVIVVVAMVGQFFYFRRFRQNVFTKVNDDIELQTQTRNNNNLSSHGEDDDIAEFLIEDEDDGVSQPPSYSETDKKKKKTGYKTADKEELSDLMKDRDE